MKIQVPQSGGDSPPPRCPDPLAEARERFREVEKRKAADLQTGVRAVLIGGFAVVAVFAALEGLRPEPTAPEPLAARLVDEPAPAAVRKPTAAPVAEPPSAVPETVPQVTPPVTPELVDTEPAGPTVAEELAAEPVLVLTGMDAGREAAITRDRELLERALTAGAWDAYRGLLGRSVGDGMTSLRSGQGRDRFKPVWDTPALYQALLRWRVLGWFPESQITAHVTDTYSGAMLLWLLNHNQAMEEVLLTMHQNDDPGAVLKFLIDAWAVNEELFEKYFSLALACAVVFDRPVNIPHPVGEQRYGVEQTVDALKRYRWYVEKNEAGKLVAPVHRSNARDLVWVVCAPVTTSELEWAIDKMHGRRANWGDNYGRIEYLMERAVNGLNPYQEYSFAEILKQGGICGDQAYFCVNTARAHGIPAMVISGETDSGSHAWAGLKTSAREWSTATGRIGGASKGTAGNPQTGQSITEQEILHWNDRHHQSDLTTLAVFRHLWLADHFNHSEKTDDHSAIVRLANSIGRSFTATWSALHAVLEREMEYTGEPAVPANLDEWKAFVADMRREFKDNPRMAALAVEAEMEYVFPYVSAGDITRSMIRERRRISRDAGEQADLIAGALKREATVISRRGGPNALRDIGRLYDRALRDYGGSVTGFKAMAEDYFGFVRADPALARKAARDIELAFKRVVETGTKDWFRANTESEIYRMICRYYREAGDSKRADMLEKRIEVLLRRSRRGAL